MTQKSCVICLRWTQGRACRQTGVLGNEEGSGLTVRPPFSALGWHRVTSMKTEKAEAVVPPQPL